MRLQEVRSELSVQRPGVYQPLQERCRADFSDGILCFLRLGDRQAVTPPEAAAERRATLQRWERLSEPRSRRRQ